MESRFNFRDAGKIKFECDSNSLFALVDVIQIVNSRIEEILDEIDTGIGDDPNSDFIDQMRCVQEGISSEIQLFENYMDNECPDTSYDLYEKKYT